MPNKIPWSLQAMLLVMMLIGLMLPFYIGGIVFIVILLILIFTNTLTETALPENPVQTVLWLFVFYSFVIATVHLNLMGVLTSIALMITLIFFSYYVKEVHVTFLETIITLMLGTSVVAIVLAMLEFFDVIEWDYSFISPILAQDTGWRVEATFFNPNYYAMMLEFFITFCAYRFVEASTTASHVGYALLGAANFVVLLFTGSRSAILVIPAVLFIFLYIIGYKRQALSLLLIMVGLTLIGLVIGLFPRLDSIGWALGDRMDIWQHALTDIKDNLWFGQGFFAYGHLAPLYDYPFKPHAHNLYLDILLNFGLIGASLFALPVAYLAHLINRLRYYPAVRPQLALYCGMFACVLVHGLSDVPILWLQTGYVFLFVILTAPNLERDARNGNLPESILVKEAEHHYPEHVDR